jgi:hypothetical protein
MKEGKTDVAVGTNLSADTKITFLIALALATTLAGCASNSANMRIGGEQSYTNLADQRAAVQTIKVRPAVPLGAIVIGEVNASRCYRNMLDQAPTTDEVTTDLIVAAYTKGADGIANVHIDQTIATALLKNCWSTLVGRATAFRFGQRNY